MNFISNLSKYLTIAVDIAPHLQTILQLIVQQNNSPHLIPNQWTILASELQGLRGKLVRLGFRFDSMANIENGGQDKHQQLIEMFMSAITDFAAVIREEVFKPSLKASIMDEEFEIDDKVLQLIKVATEELKPTMSVHAAPGDMFYDTYDTKRSIRYLLDDALLALSRVRPSRRLCAGGSLYLRDIGTFSILMHKDTWPKVSEFLDHYIAEITPLVEPIVQILLRPKRYYFDHETCSNLYLQDITTLTVYDLFKSVDMTKSHTTYILESDYRRAAMIIDINFGPSGIYNRLIGSAITSLDFAMDLLCLIGEDITEKASNKTFNDFRSRFAGYHVNDIMNIISPVDLNNMVLAHKVAPKTLSMLHETILREITMIKMGVFKLGMYNNYVNEIMSSSHGLKKVPNEVGLYPVLAPSAPIKGLSYKFSL